MALHMEEIEAWTDGGRACEIMAGLAPWARDDRPVTLIAGAGGRTDAIGRWGDRAGLRCLDRVGIGDVVDRLADIARLDLLLLDLRGSDLARLDERTAATLKHRDGFESARFAIIVDMAGLDCAIALLDGPDAEFLCDPADSEIVSLLVMAGLGERRTSSAVAEGTGQESETARLEQLSEEVRRLATTIERMTLRADDALGAAGAVREKQMVYRAAVGAEGVTDTVRLFQPRGRLLPSAPSEDVTPTHADIRALIRARRMRDQFLPADLFADPAWDMILDLLAARLAGQRVSVSSLCIASAVPPTTALRWIRQLTDRAILARIDDPLDGRRVFIELSDTAAEAVLGWVRAVRRKGGLLAAAIR